MGRRFRVEPGSLDGAPVRVPLGAEESHHVRVARLRGGSRVVVFDGLGNEAEGVLEIGSEESVWVVDLEPTASQAESHLDVVVLQALPVKLQRLDATVRLCTELGMQALEPLVTERSQLPSGGEAVLARRVTRWQRIAESAAKQSGRAVVPEVRAAVRFAEMSWERLPGTVWMLDPTADRSLVAAVREHSEGAAAILVGPEGGWSDAELAAAAEAGAQRVHMGPRVLRADSAAAAALAVIQALRGDLA
jgi:16S rRNA (uracil1498-N3)-methyltransferase